MSCPLVQRAFGHFLHLGGGGDPRVVVQGHLDEGEAEADGAPDRCPRSHTVHRVGSGAVWEGWVREGEGSIPHRAGAHPSAKGSGGRKMPFSREDCFGQQALGPKPTPGEASHSTKCLSPLLRLEKKKPGVPPK